MLYSLSDSQFKEIERAPDVHFLVKSRVLYGRARPRHCRHMDDAAYRLGREQVLQRVAIAYIGVYDPEVGVAHERGDVAVLARRVVVIIEIVERDHSLAPRQQRLNRMRANEARAARHQYLH